jgi:UDP-N-acetyl-D-galactosamine dehydrogenase
VKAAPVIVLGLTFKEDCPDLRNSRVIDVIRELESYGATVHVHDPVADPAEALHEYGIRLVPWDELPKAAALVAAVAPRGLKTRTVDEYATKLERNGVVVDVKCQFAAGAFAAHPVTVWRL